MNVPNKFDIILYLIRLNGNRFEGKTNLHKNLFLISLMMGNIDLEQMFAFEPYLYGPFSRNVSSGIDMLSDFGLIRTDIETSEGDEFEYRKHFYELTKTGEKVADNTGTRYSEFAKSFKGCFDVLQESGFHQNTRIMATAAKIILVLKSSQRPMTPVTIQNAAKELGWVLNITDMEKAKSILEKTELMKVDSPSS